MGIIGALVCKWYCRHLVSRYHSLLTVLLIFERRKADYVVQNKKLAKHEAENNLPMGWRYVE
jgi:hypothetical protein